MQIQQAPFGSVLCERMAVTRFSNGEWTACELVKTGPRAIHPGSHGLHYGSTCFEGFKAYRWADGSVHVFRLDRHFERFKQSASLLCLPVPSSTLLSEMTLALIACVRTQIPVAPGALYIRPILYGTTPNLGAAMVPSIDAELVILASPVWDYFASGAKALRLLVDEHHARAVPHLGMAKTGGNYVAAVALMRVAKQRFAADQILFCPEGQVQETGAANFLLLREGAVLTRSLDPSFLHGVTRDSLLNLARDMGYVTEERIFNVAEMIDWVRDGEAALSGTAAVLTGVGELIHKGQVHRIGSGTTGEHTSRLCDALKAVQRGEREDARGWLTAVPAL